MAQEASGLALNWREAEHADRGPLSWFICTSPSKAKYVPGVGDVHERPWELRVQSWIRDSRPPRPRDEKLVLGRDDQGIAAVVHVGLDDEDCDQIQIFTVARALRCRRKDYGSEALAVALDICRSSDEALGLNGMALGRVHVRNDRSRELLRSHGFEMNGVSGEYERWFYDLRATEA